MVRENHKMVREMSGKSQVILLGLMAGHPDINCFPTGTKMRKFIHFFKKLSDGIIYCPEKNMFHSRDSLRLLVYDTGLYLEEKDIGFITVAICGGCISKNTLD